MDPTLVGLLVWCIVFAASSFYLSSFYPGFRVPGLGCAWMSQAAFLVTLVTPDPPRAMRLRPNRSA